MDTARRAAPTFVPRRGHDYGVAGLWQHGNTFCVGRQPQTGLVRAFAPRQAALIMALEMDGKLPYTYKPNSIDGSLSVMKTKRLLLSTPKASFWPALTLRAFCIGIYDNPTTNAPDPGWLLHYQAGNRMAVAFAQHPPATLDPLYALLGETGGIRNLSRGMSRFGNGVYFDDYKLTGWQAVMMMKAYLCGAGTHWDMPLRPLN
jgi:hypothetical protein